MTSSIGPPNSSYGVFSDYKKSFKRWFYKGYQAELKDVQLEHVLNGTTKQPISLYEFRFYLQNKEHSAENLEFHYWFQDYKRRFQALTEDQESRSPPPTETLSPDFSRTVDYDNSKINMNQPFREELDATLLTYFNTRLHLDDHISRYTIYCGTETTHPDVFEAAYKQTYKFMETKSLKSFVHQGVQNVCYGFIVLQLTFDVVSLILIPIVLFNTFAMHMSRWTRLFLFMFTLLFCMGLLSGRSGFCILRNLFKVRQVPAHLLSDDYKPSSGRLNQIDLMSNNKHNQQKKNLTQVLDDEVIKYNRQMGFHIICTSLLIAIIVTVIGVTITNENDPMPPIATPSNL